MIYTALNASITRTARQRFSESSIAGSKGKRSYSFSGGLIRAFIDTFNRADNGSSLTGAGTKNWVAWNGIWGISSNKANTATAASSYPAAVVKTGTTNARTKVTFGSASTHGWGTLFWGTSASQWYGTYGDRTWYQTGPFTAYYCTDPNYTENCGTGKCGKSSCTGGSGSCAEYHDCVGWTPGTPILGTCPDGRQTWECGGYQCSGGSTGYCPNVCGGGCGFVNECRHVSCQNTNFVQAASYQYYIDNYLYWIRTIAWNGSATVLNSVQVANTTDGGRHLQSIQVTTNTPANNNVRIAYRLNGQATDTTYDLAVTPIAQGKHYGMFIAPRNGGTNPGAQAADVDEIDYSPL